jgi:hypothetical protein
VLPDAGCFAPRCRQRTLHNRSLDRADKHSQSVWKSLILFLLENLLAFATIFGQRLRLDRPFRRDHRVIDMLAQRSLSEVMRLHLEVLTQGFDGIVEHPSLVAGFKDCFLEMGGSPFPSRSAPIS